MMCKILIFKTYAGKFHEVKKNLNILNFMCERERERERERNKICILFYTLLWGSKNLGPYSGLKYHILSIMRPRRGNHRETS